MKYDPRRARKYLERSRLFQIFGHYSYLPVFFLAGAAVEFTMIKWEVNGVNFYKTFKRRQAAEKAEALFQQYLQGKESQEHN